MHNTDLDVLRTQLLLYATRELGTYAQMPNLVKRDLSSNVLSQKTDKIRISVSEMLYDRGETIGTTAANVQKVGRNIRDIIFYNRESPVRMNMDDYRKIDINANIFPDVITELSRAIALTINRKILMGYRDIYKVTGTVSTSPFSADASALTAAKTKLLVAPKQERFLILNEYDAERASNLSGFTTTNAGQISETGDFVKKLGFNIFVDPDIHTHVAGTGADMQVNGVSAKGSTSIAIDSVTGGTLMYGDIITFAGHTQTYVVGKGEFEGKHNDDDEAQGVDLDYTSVSDVTSAIIEIQPPLQAEVADNAAITLTPTHNVSLAYQKNAFIYAPRTVEVMGDSEYRKTLTEPTTGTPLKFTVQDEWKQQTSSLDAYYGTGTLYNNFAVRLIGQPYV